MLDLSHRIKLTSTLKDYLESDSLEWKNTITNASLKNPWFSEEHIKLAIKNIIDNYLDANKIEYWMSKYSIPNKITPKRIGIVMAGNIPLVGFHDFFCVWMSGHQAIIKTSSKDEVLIKHLVSKLIQFDPTLNTFFTFQENLLGCDAYIATGGTNTNRYFDYYFGKYPNIIRSNKSSVAILTGMETFSNLEALASDIQLYYGLGCRNVTKLFVPEGYDFIPLLNALKKYEHHLFFHKYRHNYDYQLALLMMSNKLYMTNGSILLVEDSSIYTPVSRVNYQYYNHKDHLLKELKINTSIQCLVGDEGIPFGFTQQPSLTDYADGIDTMKFLLSL